MENSKTTFSLVFSAILVQNFVRFGAYLDGKSLLYKEQLHDGNYSNLTPEIPPLPPILAAPSGVRPWWYLPVLGWFVHYLWAPISPR